MNYLIDTNIASYVMGQRPTITARIEGLGGAGLLAISAITLAELKYGIRVMPEGSKKARLLKSLEDMLETGMDIRPFTAEASEVYSVVGAALKEAGIASSFEDLAIASTAIAENKTLASNDGFFDHVSRLCGLRFERWEH